MVDIHKPEIISQVCRECKCLVVFIPKYHEKFRTVVCSARRAASFEICARSAEFDLVEGHPMPDHVYTVGFF